MIDTQVLNAVDLRTVSATPVTAYVRGFEDAYMQNVYHNFFRDRASQREYGRGHEDGRKARTQIANA